MPPKRKNEDATDMMDRPEKKTKAVKKSRNVAEVYSTQQKAAITQFISFTQLDRNTAVRMLKSHAWDAQTAVNTYYSGGSGSTSSPAAKTTLNKLFDKYKEVNTVDADTVGVEGTMQYFQDTDVDVEGLESLAALEVVQAPTMGEMSREGFVNSWHEKNCETIDSQKAFIKNLKKDLPGNRDLFARVYKYTFILAKTGGQKAVALEAAIAYWELLFSSPISPVKWTSQTTPWLTWWTEFLNSSWKKSVNKDMWNETLKFAQLTLDDEAMSFWNEESSWPSVIDDFVEWVKNEKRGGTQQDVMEEDY